MKRFIIILIMSLSQVSANTINEDKTDIYFGNGVWNSQFTKTNCQKQDAAECSQRYLNRLVKKEIIQNDSKLIKKYGSVKLAYNWTRGAVGDLLETFYQLKNSGQITQTYFFAFVDELAAKTAADVKDTPLEEMRKIIIDALSQTEQSNVDEMLPKYYLESLYKSHRVLLVSHSQGNMFANRIYNSIMPKEYQNYFANLQVGSPADKVHAKIGSGENEYVTLIGDGVINPIPGSMPGNVSPDSHINLNLNHPFVESYLGNSQSLEKIIDNLHKLLDEVNVLESQWKISDKKDEGTKEYRGTFSHKFHTKDVDILYGKEDLTGFIFKEDNDVAYVYQVPDTSEAPHYVKASFGGERILSADDVNEWEAEEGQFYKLEGTGEIIEGEMSCKDPSLFEVISQENENTAQWRITVKNKETNETTEGVYPFNLQGSLYQVDSEEWVLASCGGTEILDKDSSDWSDKKEGQFYKLVSTTPEEYIEELEKEILIYYVYDEFFGADYPDFKVENSFNVSSDASEVLVSMSDVNGCGYIDNGSYVYWSITISVNDVAVISYDHAPGAHDDKTKFRNVDITDIVHAGENDITASCKNRTGRYDMIESYVFAKIQLQRSDKED